MATRLPQLIFCDNTSAMTLVKNAKLHDKSKHIDVKHHFVHDAHEKGLINLQYLPTADMPADIMTKALAHDAYWKHVGILGLREMDQKSA
jgi:hypothetical protein